MSNKNIEARREAFDAWHRAEQEEKWQSALKEFGLEPAPMPEQFLQAAKLLHWRIWNAALDSICVELPKSFESYGCMGEGMSDPDMVIDEEAIREALDAAGVKYK